MSKRQEVKDAILKLMRLQVLVLGTLGSLKEQRDLIAEINKEQEMKNSNGVER